MIGLKEAIFWLKWSQTFNSVSWKVEVSSEGQNSLKTQLSKVGVTPPLRLRVYWKLGSQFSSQTWDILIKHVAQFVETIKILKLGAGNGQGQQGDNNWDIIV